MADFSHYKVGNTTYDVKDAIARAELPNKLTMVSTLPATPADGQIVLYIGATTATLVQGGTYKYDAQTASWILISSANVEAIPTTTVQNYFV